MHIPDTHTPADQTRPDAPVLELDRFLPYRLSVLSNRISLIIARRYQQRFGLSVTQWRVMAVLGRYPGLSAGAVAERTAMDKVAISRAIAGLLQRDLVLRDIHDTDRRRSVLELSAAGQRVYAEVAPLALAYERALLDAINDAEYAQLERLITRLATRCEEISTRE